MKACYVKKNSLSLLFVFFYILSPFEYFSQVLLGKTKKKTKIRSENYDIIISCETLIYVSSREHFSQSPNKRNIN